MKSYLRHRVSNVVDVKELIALEYLDFEGKYRNYSEAHDFWELCCVEYGDITLTVGSQTYSLSENELFVIAPNSRHKYFSEAGNAARVFVACFESFSHNLLPLSNLAFPLQSAERLCIDRIICESKNTFFTNADDMLEIRESALFGGQQALLLQLEYLLICLLRQLSDAQNPSLIFVNGENFHRELTDAIIRYVRENMDKRMTLTDICSRFSYSQSFICKIFKQQTGETVIEYVNRMKTEEACRLLTKTTMKVNEIGAALGFRETKYFDALFKKIMGITPTLYRKDNQYGKGN